ncbi:MAG: YceD family protein [Caldisericota bacterium]|nr:YceD family protein [Caldisericota bacterium]
MSIRNKIVEIHEKLLDIDFGNNRTIVLPILLTGQMVGNPTTDKTHFNGCITAKLILVCVQCLKKFKEAFDISFEETYLPKNKNKVSMSEEKSIENLDIFVYHGDCIDTVKIVKDILLKAILPYPLCQKCRALDNS